MTAAPLLRFEAVLLTEVGDPVTLRLRDSSEAMLRFNLALVGVTAARVVSITRVPVQPVA